MPSRLLRRDQLKRPYGTRFRFSSLASVWLSAAVLSTGLAALPAQQLSDPGGSASAATISPLAAGETREFTLAPGGGRNLSVSVPAGTMILFQMQQLAGMSSMTAVRTDGKAGPVFSSDGGLGSRIRMVVEGGDAGASYVVTFTTREKHRSSEVRISERELVAPSKEDSTLAELEDTLAQAETIRRGLSKSPPQQAESLYDAVIAASQKLALEPAAASSTVSDPVSLERRAWTGKARLLMYREENYLGAEQAAHHAVELSQGDGDAADRGDRALAWKTYSSALALLNRYEGAIDANQRAMQLYEQMADEYWQGIVAGNLAFIYRETGQTAKAMDFAERALKLAADQKDDYGRAFALSAEGAIAQGIGDDQTALDRYFQSLDVLAELGKDHLPLPAEGEVWSNMGEVYADLNDWDQAEYAFRKALPAVRAAADGVNEIEVDGELAAVELRAGKLEQADQDYRAALTRAGELGLERERTHLLAGLAETRAAEHRADAPTLFEQEAAEARAIHQVDGEAEAFAGLADWYSASHRTEAAQRAYTRAEDLWREIPNAAEAAKAEANLARIDEQEGRLERARREIFAALDQVEEARDSLVSKSLRTSYFSSRHAYFELAVDVLMDMEARTPGKGYAEQAWAVAERARARTLLDELEGKSRSTAFDTEQSGLESRIQDAEDTLAHFGTSPEDAAKAEATSREIHELILAADRAAQDARSHKLDDIPNLKPIAEAEKAAGNPALKPDILAKEALGNDTALYEYWTGARRSYLWTVSSRGFSSYILPRAQTLRRLANRYMTAITAREQFPDGEGATEREHRIGLADREAMRSGEELGAMLLPGRQPGLRRIVIVTDGPLENVSFAGLRVRAAQPGLQPGSRAAGPGAAHYLVEQYEILTEPSARALMQWRRPMQHGLEDRLESVAVFADPVYSSTDPRVAREAAPGMIRRAAAGSPLETAARSWSLHPENPPDLLRQARAGLGMPQLPRLPDSRREALSIRDLAGPAHTDLYLDLNANPRTLTGTDWSGYRVLHIAAHAVANEEQPELSGIVLSMVDRNGAPVNGVVRLREVYRMHAPVDLVVLSACGTFDGKTIRGEGIDGLVRAFLVAGARSVIASRWGADDASTSELIQAFYAGYLGENKTASAALRAARQKLIAGKRFSAPYYWAGMVLEGSWQEQ